MIRVAIIPLDSFCGFHVTLGKLDPPPTIEPLHEHRTLMCVFYFSTTTVCTVFGESLSPDRQERDIDKERDVGPQALYFVMYHPLLRLPYVHIRPVTRLYDAHLA